ncbi:MAG: hypothetical protein ACREI8_14430 [Myxococcota bacterium]
MSLRTKLIALCFVLAAPALAAPFGGNGTDILHLSLRVAFTPDADADAAGSLAAKLRQQGNADVQKLRLEVSGLAPETTHHLFVSLRGVVDPVDVLSFDTDENGDASLKLMHLGHKDVPGKKFPPALDGLDLDPLSDVVGMDVRSEADLNVVLLAADLTAPDPLKYLVKRRLDPNESVDTDAAGSLFMKESSTKVQFRLRAGNLEPDTGYTLVIIAGPTETTFPVTTDADGRLDLKELPDLAPTPFEMTGLELRLGVDVVLSTTLPSAPPGP